MLTLLCVIAEMTVGKDQEVTVKSKGAGGQGKVAAKVTAPSGKPVTSKVWHLIWIYCLLTKILYKGRIAMFFFPTMHLL